jgi:hypothetical protein
MITLTKSSAFRSGANKDDFGSFTPEDCQKFLAQYISSKVRLWAYSRSLSRLVLRIDRPASERLPPIDLVFVSLLDIRSPVHWIIGTFEIRHDPKSATTIFEVPSAGIAVSAADLTIVVQDEYPHKIWELDE